VTRVADDRLLLAGDATGYLSPFTGMGCEFAMRMGRVAADAAQQALATGDCSANAFARYVEDRRSRPSRASPTSATCCTTSATATRSCARRRTTSSARASSARRSLS
jgi:2-polyprenyl-6-methoxyphenol hydroxylase-like FAD-dependent oxidoreductase